jgi:hypothetical protein
MAMGAGKSASVSVAMPRRVIPMEQERFDTSCGLAQLHAAQGLLRRDFIVC